jgi:hypothetical protein
VWYFQEREKMCADHSSLVLGFLVFSRACSEAVSGTWEGGICVWRAGIYPTRGAVRRYLTEVETGEKNRVVSAAARGAVAPSCGVCAVDHGVCGVCGCGPLAVTQCAQRAPPAAMSAVRSKRLEHYGTRGWVGDERTNELLCALSTWTRPRSSLAPRATGLDNTKYGRIFNIILIRIIRNTWSSQV